MEADAVSEVRTRAQAGTAQFVTKGMLARKWFRNSAHSTGSGRRRIEANAQGARLDLRSELIGHLSILTPRRLPSATTSVPLHAHTIGISAPDIAPTAMSP